MAERSGPLLVPRSHPSSAAAEKDGGGEFAVQTPRARWHPAAARCCVRLAAGSLRLADRFWVALNAVSAAPFRAGTAASLGGGW